MRVGTAQRIWPNQGVVRGRNPFSTGQGTILCHTPWLCETWSNASGFGDLPFSRLSHAQGTIRSRESGLDTTNVPVSRNRSDPRYAHGTYQPISALHVSSHRAVAIATQRRHTLSSTLQSASSSLSSSARLGSDVDAAKPLVTTSASQSPHPLQFAWDPLVMPGSMVTCISYCTPHHAPAASFRTHLPGLSLWSCCICAAEMPVYVIWRERSSGMPTVCRR